VPFSQMHESLALTINLPEIISPRSGRFRQISANSGSMSLFARFSFRSLFSLLPSCNEIALRRYGIRRDTISIAVCSAVCYAFVL